MLQKLEREDPALAALFAQSVASDPELSSDIARQNFSTHGRGDALTRLEAALVGHDPELEHAQRLRLRGVELAVADAAAGAHVLHVAAAQHGAVALAVAVRERAVDHVGHDLHVLVAVRAEARAGRDHVVVEHAQRAEAQVRRIEVVGEGEGVAGLQPAEVGAAALRRGALVDHGAGGEVE